MSGGIQRKRIGDFMMEKGLIHRDWIGPILDHAKAQGLRFGEAAVALGYVKESELREVLLAPYAEQEIFRLDPAFLPTITADLIPVEVMIRLGVVPLGYKREFHWFRSRRRLNLGVLASDRRGIEEWAAKNLKNVNSFKVFQILPDEFLQTLELRYGIDRTTLLDLGPERIDANFALYLQLEKRERPSVAK